LGLNGNLCCNHLIWGVSHWLLGVKLLANHTGNRLKAPNREQLSVKWIFYK
jgi:hypothetical protein